MLRQLVFATVFAAPMLAQAPVHTVSGRVFDSVAKAPLAGAVVQVALVELAAGGAAGPAATRVFSATADAEGRFRIPGLPSGRFAIGFQHDALNALGLESPLRAFELASDTAMVVDLAVPGGPAVRARLCGDSIRLEGEGMVAGYVTDARHDGLLKGAVVRARWLEVALEKKGMRTVTRMVTAIVDDDGKYLACGIATDDAVTVEVTMPGYRSFEDRVTIPRGGAARQDFHLPQSGVMRGTGSLDGRALITDASPLPAGRAVIATLGLDVPISNGEFSIRNIPAGTWSVEARALGFEPTAVLVHVRDGAATPARLVLPERAQVLDVVAVRGRRGGNDKILAAIKSRQSVSIGTIFLPGDPWLESAYDPADVARNAAGFRYVSPEVLLSSGCGFKYPPPDEPVAPGGPPRQRIRTLAVYMDGLRVVGGLAQLKTSVTMKDILAVEAYPDISSAPLEWRTNDACAVLAVWTTR